LLFRELHFFAHHGHQWRDAKPGEEAEEEGDPRHVERAHLGRRPRE
jgi:hypothetical protein